MRDSGPKLIVFTDLDGTLLDRETYSYKKSLPIINYLWREGIPIIFCPAKTRAEQEVYRQAPGDYGPIYRRKRRGYFHKARLLLLQI